MRINTEYLGTIDIRPVVGQRANRVWPAWMRQVKYREHYRQSDRERQPEYAQADSHAESNSIGSHLFEALARRCDVVQCLSTVAMGVCLGQPCFPFLLVGTFHGAKARNGHGFYGAEFENGALHLIVPRHAIDPAEIPGRGVHRDEKMSRPSRKQAIPKH
jgi:hypothetical protein